MSTFDSDRYQDLRDHFGHDDTDDTYGLTTWFTPSEVEAIVQFCMAQGICPSLLVYYAVESVMRATVSSDGLAVVLRIPPCN